MLYCTISDYQNFFFYNYKFILSVAISLYSSIKQSLEGNMLNTYHYRVENNVLHLYNVLYNPRLQLTIETLYSEIGVIGITYQWIIRLVFVFMPVYWRHICHDVSHHREFYCLLNCLFMPTAQGTSKLLRVDFAADWNGQYAKRDAMSWRHVKALPDRNATPRIEIGLHFQKTRIFFTENKIKDGWLYFVLFSE